MLLVGGIYLRLLILLYPKQKVKLQGENVLLGHSLNGIESAVSIQFNRQIMESFSDNG